MMVLFDKACLCKLECVQVRSIIRALELGFGVIFLDLDVNPMKYALNLDFLTPNDLV
jgi:hypothetical protein